jgi:hypothetical protein
MAATGNGCGLHRLSQYETERTEENHATGLQDRRGLQGKIRTLDLPKRKQISYDIFNSSPSYAVTIVCV